MKVYTGQVIINNGKYDKAFGVRVFAGSFTVASARAVREAMKAYRRSLDGRRPSIPHISLKLDQSKPLIHLDKKEWIDKAWLA